MVRWCILSTNASRPVKDYLENINKAFESKARLGIMSVLMVEDRVDFSTLKDTLQLTDGNLASHLRALEEGNVAALPETERLERRYEKFRRVGALGAEIAGPTA